MESRLHVNAYRSILREIHKSAVSTRKINKTLTSQFRSVIERSCQTGNTGALQDVLKARDFMQAQREYKALLERYNPLVDLTSDERIHATARRVGFDMPVTHKPETVE